MTSTKTMNLVGFQRVALEIRLHGFDIILIRGTFCKNVREIIFVLQIIF